MGHVAAAVGVLAGPLVIPQGADFAAAWVYAEGTPLTVPSGWPGVWLARMEVRDGRGGALVARFHSNDVTADGDLQVTTLAAGTPSTIPGVPDGGSAAQVVLVTTAAKSAAWTWADAAKAYPFDLELANTSGRVIRLLEGTVRLSREVTTGG